MRWVAGQNRFGGGHDGVGSTIEQNKSGHGGGDIHRDRITTLTVAIHANGGRTRRYFERNLKIDLTGGTKIQRRLLIVHEDLCTGKIFWQWNVRSQLRTAECELISENGHNVALRERFSGGECSVIDR